MRVARARYGQPWRVVGQRLQRRMTNGKQLAGGPAGTGAMAAEKLQQLPRKEAIVGLSAGTRWSGAGLWSFCLADQVDSAMPRPSGGCDAAIAGASGRANERGVRRAMVADVKSKTGDFDV
jgi:hypothetical protein